jgi:hypothetical protein
MNIRSGAAARAGLAAGAVVFTTAPIPFAVREPLVDLDATSRLGWGWHCGSRPTMTSTACDGYVITVHG